MSYISACFRLGKLIYLCSIAWLDPYMVIVIMAPPTNNVQNVYFTIGSGSGLKMDKTIKYQDPVVQSIVSLTSSLRVISLTVLADSIYNILIFFAEKMWVVFALQKLLTFFQQKISAFLHITSCKF